MSSFAARARAVSRAVSGPHSTSPAVASPAGFQLTRQSPRWGPRLPPQRVKARVGDPGFGSLRKGERESEETWDFNRGEIWGSSQLSAIGHRLGCVRLLPAAYAPTTRSAWRGKAGRRRSARMEKDAANPGLTPRATQSSARYAGWGGYDWECRRGGTCYHAGTARRVTVWKLGNSKAVMSRLTPAAIATRRQSWWAQTFARALASGLVLALCWPMAATLAAAAGEPTRPACCMRMSHACHPQPSSGDAWQAVCHSCSNCRALSNGAANLAGNNGFIFSGSIVRLSLPRRVAHWASAVSRRHDSRAPPASKFS